MGSFVGRMPTRLRLSAEDTIKKTRRDKKNPPFSHKSLVKNWLKLETAHESLHEKPDPGNPRIPLALKPVSQCYFQFLCEEFRLQEVEQ